MLAEDLKALAIEHGTPLFVVDHAVLRANYREFKEHLPRVQAYFAVKANSDAEIVKTFYNIGASFDVASMPEFLNVYENIKNLTPEEQQDFIWDKIIYANPIKPIPTLKELDQYKPLVTFDNEDEISKIATYAPNTGLILRLKVPNTGAMVELSSKFGADPGEAVDLIDKAFQSGLMVEGLSFHVGSQCTNFQNYIQALNLAANIFKESWERGHKEVKILDIGGGFPAPYDNNVKPFADLAIMLNSEFDRLFPPDIEIIAEPGRFLVATAAWVVVEIIGTAYRDGKRCYYVNDGVYHTFSGTIFDHCQYPLKSFTTGDEKMCAVYGPTCDALDTITMANLLPVELSIGDLLYSENIGAYSHASSTFFNGFPPAKVLHINK